MKSKPAHLEPKGVAPEEKICRDVCYLSMCAARVSLFGATPVIQAVPLRSATNSLLTGTPRVTLTRITASNGFSCPV